MLGGSQCKCAPARCEASEGKLTHEPQSRPCAEPTGTVQPRGLTRCMSRPFECGIRSHLFHKSLQRYEWQVTWFTPMATRNTLLLQSTTQEHTYNVNDAASGIMSKAPPVCPPYPDAPPRAVKKTTASVHGNAVAARQLAYLSYLACA